MSLPDDQQLLDDIAHASGQAQSLRRLCSLYGLSGRGRVGLRRLVKRLVARGALVKLRGVQRYGLPRATGTVVGQLTGTARGFAFVAPDDPSLPDVFIPEHQLGGALHGDRVEVEYLPETALDRPAGAVARVVTRGDQRVVGLFVRGDARRREPNRLRPFDQRINAEIVIPDRFALDAEDGVFVDAVLLRDSREGSGGGPLRARVVAILGRPDEPGTDERVIVRSFRLHEEHSPEARAEAERRAAAGIDPAELLRRRDFRNLRTVTIDGETAKDFDDAVSIEPAGAGWTLFVHIADVSHHVPEGGPLDADALERATSVYFPGRALHMLPEALSADACSLRPGEDRLTVTAVLRVDPSGQVRDADFAESVIRSDRRMTYTEMKRLLVDGDAALRAELADFLDDFQRMAACAQALIAAREARGGLDFDLPVPIVEVDAEGLVTDIVESERNVAHRIIEEFMIAANAAVARRLDAEREPAVHRNHEAPPPEKLATFREAVRVFGHEVGGGEEPAALDVRRVLDRVKGRPEERIVNALALRAMALARYETEPRGHFGLALPHYTHFTSPIRRYPDLIVHRVLKRLLAGDRTPEEDRADVLAELADLADHCSRRERDAETAERMLVEWKKVVFMAPHVGETLGARVSGLTESGVFVTLADHHVDGLIRLRELRRDYYERDAAGTRLVGRDTGRVLRLGDTIRVRILQVDTFRRRIDMEEA